MTKTILKALIAIVLITTSGLVKAQQTYWTPGVPTGSTSFSPTFRYLGTDSTASFYINNSNRWSQFYTSAQSNLRYASNSTTLTIEGVSQSLSAPPVFNSLYKYEVGQGKQYATVTAALAAAPAKNFTIYVYDKVYDHISLAGKDSLTIEGVGQAVLIDTTTAVGDAVFTSATDSTRLKLSNIIIWRKGRNIIANNSRGLFINKYSTVWGANVQVKSDMGDGVYTVGNSYNIFGSSTTRNRIGFVNNGVPDSTVSYLCKGKANYEGYSNHGKAVDCLGESIGTYNGQTGGGFGNAGIALNDVGKSDSTFGFINHNDGTNPIVYARNCTGINLNTSNPNGYQNGYQNQATSYNAMGWSKTGNGIINYATLIGGQAYSQTGNALSQVIDTASSVGVTAISDNAYAISLGKGSLYSCNGYSRTGSAANITDSVKSIVNCSFKTQSATQSCVKFFYATHKFNGDTLINVSFQGGLYAMQGSSNTHLWLINCNYYNYGTRTSGIINDYTPPTDTLRVGNKTSTSDAFNYKMFRNSSGNLEFLNNTATDANTGYDFFAGAAQQAVWHVATSNSSQMGNASENGTHINVLSGTSLTSGTRLDISSTVLQSYNNGTVSDLLINPSGGNIGMGDAANNYKLNLAVSGTNGYLNAGNFSVNAAGAVKATTTYNTAAGTPNSDSLVVKIGGTLKLGAIAATTYGAISATNIWTGENDFATVNLKNTSSVSTPAGYGSVAALSGGGFRFTPTASGSFFQFNNSGSTAAYFTINSTQSGGDNITFPDVANATVAYLANPALTGVPTAPTASAGTNTTQLATTAFVFSSLGTIRASADLTGQTGAVSSIASYTTSATGTYRVGAYANITAISTDVLEVQVTFTDVNSNVQTLNFYPQGATTALLSTTGYYSFPTYDFRALTGTAITVKTILTTGGGTITYNTGATITQLR